MLERLEANPINDNPAPEPESPNTLAVSAPQPSSGFRRTPPKLKGLEEGNAGGRRAINLRPTGDPKEFAAAFAQALGTHDPELADNFLTQLVNAVQPDGAVTLPLFNSLLAALHGIAPTDELEGMLAAQMVAVHRWSMESLRRAGVKDQTADGVERNINRATKLMRTFVAQMEALTRYRGKGQQKVTVEHVHVNQGGQAIVGAVTHAAGATSDAR